MKYKKIFVAMTDKQKADFDAYYYRQKLASKFAKNKDKIVGFTKSEIREIYNFIKAQ